MSLTAESIQNAASDEDLFELLSGELSRLFPPELQEDPDRFLARLAEAPRGLRAMAVTHALDVSMSLDDLAWHFLSHNDERFLQETAAGLQELEAKDANEIFLEAWALVKPELAQIQQVESSTEDPNEFLERVGLQQKMDP